MVVSDHTWHSLYSKRGSIYSYPFTMNTVRGTNTAQLQIKVNVHAVCAWLSLQQIIGGHCAFQQLYDIISTSIGFSHEDYEAIIVPEQTSELSSTKMNKVENMCSVDSLSCNYI